MEELAGRMNKRLSILMIVIWKTEYKGLAPLWSKKLQSVGSELIQRSKARREK